MKTSNSPQHIPVPRPAFDRHAGAITVLMNLMFVRHLTSVYQAFDGDIVAAIVLGEIAHHNYAPFINRARTPRELSEALNALAAGSHEDLLPTNAYSIAQATGIPRESVRRRIAGLVRRGWLEKDANGNLFVSSSAFGAFAERNFERANDLLDAAGAIQTLVDEGSAAAAGSR